MHSIRLPIEKFVLQCVLVHCWFPKCCPQIRVDMFLWCCHARACYMCRARFHICFWFCLRKRKFYRNELIFFKSFCPNFLEKWFLVSRNLMFSKSFKTSSSKGFNSKMVGGVLLDERPKWLVFSWFFSPFRKKWAFHLMRFMFPPHAHYPVEL